jgi:hypothetical protein
MNMSQRISRRLVHLPAPVTFNLSQVGTVFTYQGRLNANSRPANGLYDLRFVVWDALSNGNLVAGPLTNSATSVINGLFNVMLDFGSGVFTGPNRWLEIGVRTNGPIESRIIG